MYRIFIIFLSIASVGCNGGNDTNTSCGSDDSHFSIRSEVNRQPAKSIIFDSDGGVSFRGFELISSASDVRSNIDLIYNLKERSFTVHAVKNDWELSNIAQGCISELDNFLKKYSINVLIEYK